MIFHVLFIYFGVTSNGVFFFVFFEFLGISTTTATNSGGWPMDVRYFDWIPTLWSDSVGADIV